MAKNSKSVKKSNPVNPGFITSKPIDKTAESFATLSGLINFLSAAQKHMDNFNVLLNKKGRESF